MPELDTDALRALADELYGDWTDWSPTEAHGHGDKVEAAADTIDALRAELNAAHAQVEVRARANDRLWTRAVSAEAERAALRRIIAEAPHDPRCPQSVPGWWTADDPCDCWKSRIEVAR